MDPTKGAQISSKRNGGQMKRWSIFLYRTLVKIIPEYQQQM
jgi:hypothetical protein